MRHVVLHHAHHHDEGVYRLVIGVMDEHTIPVEAPNPDYNHNHPDGLIYHHLTDQQREQLDGDVPTEGQNTPTILQDETRQVLVDQHDIVFADHDEQWAGRSQEEIAAEQLRLAREALAAHAAAAAPEVTQRVTQIGATGQDL